MPLYEFLCTKCTSRYTEHFHADKKKKTAPCPKCGSVGKRVFSIAGVHFKGKGFHSTDYGTGT